MVPRGFRVAGLGMMLAVLASCADQTPPPASSVPAPAPPPKAAPPSDGKSKPKPKPKPAPAPAPIALHCDTLFARQDGRDVRPVNGTLELARRPFALVYTGGLPEPSLYASAFATLAEQLAKTERREVWGSADDYSQDAIADLPIREGAGLVEDPDLQDLHLDGMGEGYAAFFHAMTALGDEPSAFLWAPRLGGGFESGAGGLVAEVRAVGGTPVEKTSFRQLYLTYYASIERVGPGNKSNFGRRLLVRLAWGSCRLAFR